MYCICLSLLLPVACVIAIPPQYEKRDNQDQTQTQYQITQQADNHELPAEFWTEHFGPEFQHAVHLQLGQTDLIDTTNTIGKHSSQTKEGNKKRSAYIVHKPHSIERDNRTSHMQVHLMQPDEVEALERELMSYAEQNKMAESPVVVNLPVSEGSTKSKEKPVILSVPPVVYHHGNQPYYVESPKSSWPHSKQHPSYEKAHSLESFYGKGQSSQVKMQPSYDPYVKVEPLYDYKNGITGQQLSEGSGQYVLDDRHPPSKEIKTSTKEESKTPSQVDKSNSSSQPTNEEPEQPKRLLKE